MRILVVDDEYFSRKALVQIIQDWNPQAHVYEAEDGQEAIEQLQNVSPHLVLSDIRMPILDGIGLAAYIHEHHADTINIIISGYDDFKYAQQAIRYKVEHYLLKPVDKEHIWSLLEQYRHQTELSSEKRMEEGFAALLYEGTTSKLDPVDMDDIGGYAIAIVRVNADYKEPIKQLIKKTLLACSLRFVAIVDRRYSDMFLVWMYELNPGSAAGAAVNQEGLKHIIRDALHMGECHVCVGISGVHTDIKELTACYKEAKSVLLYRLISGDNRIYDAEYAAMNRPFNYGAIDEWISGLYHKLVKYQTKEAVETLSHFFANVVQLTLSVNVLHDMCAKVTTMLNSVIELTNTRSDAAEAYLEQIDLHEVDAIQDIIDEFTQVMIRLGERLAQNRAKTGMIEDIQYYVQHHYQQDIMLEDLAKTMYYTDPTYLSRLFKKKTGMRFSQFLLSVRMQNAKAMLENDTSLSISEVSSAVGFNDYSYFIQMYKKCYGETPGKYKSSNHSNKPTEA